ncbi:MAG TPA: hypothetical protein VFX07_09305 [Candidatus Udaeobacter sp.]|nr:hypothetical protein [Candidatus Udaeobacter sp.]
MINHLSELIIWNPAFNLNGVPVFLVHVVTGPDLLVPIPKVER